MKKDNLKKLVITLMVLMVTLISIFGISKKASDPKMYKKTIAALDEKKNTILKMTASSAAAATAMATIPGDATTPVANKLADLTSYFLAMLSVVFLEKYLVTLSGYVAFKFLIPFACVIAIIAVWWEKHFLRILAAKIALFGIVIFTIIPISMKVSNIIEETYEISAEITMKEAEELVENINDNIDTEGNVVTKFIKKVQSGISGLVVKGEALLGLSVNR